MLCGVASIQCHCFVRHLRALPDLPGGEGTRQGHFGDFPARSCSWGLMDGGVLGETIWAEALLIRLIVFEVDLKWI
jgi:hypothetical protein